jgi:hypothetical protein
MQLAYAFLISLTGALATVAFVEQLAVHHVLDSKSVRKVMHIGR